MDRFDWAILIGPRIDALIAEIFTVGISWLIVIPTSSILTFWQYLPYNKGRTWYEPLHQHSCNWRRLHALSMPNIQEKLQGYFSASIDFQQSICHFRNIFFEWRICVCWFLLDKKSNAIHCIILFNLSTADDRDKSVHTWLPYLHMSHDTRTLSQCKDWLVLCWYSWIKTASLLQSYSAQTVHCLCIFFSPERDASKCAGQELMDNDWFTCWTITKWARN